MSQPLATVPMMSKMPIRASSPALVDAGIPWSCAAGMKCVPIRPFVDQPQIQNVPKRIQNVRLRVFSRNAPIATRAALWVGGAGLGVGPLAPYAVVPMSLGWSRSSHQTKGTSSAAKTVVTAAAQRQPGPSARLAMAGRKISWPVELAAEKTPITTPRFFTNQRLATTAPKTSASEPVPMPIANPHSSQSCHGLVITSVRPLPSATRVRDAATTRRMPKRSISAAAKGAVRP